MCDIGFEIYVQNEKMECVKNAEKKEEHHRAGMSDECNASIFFLWEGSRGREAWLLPVAFS